MDGRITIYNTIDFSVKQRLSAQPSSITALTYDQINSNTIFYLTASGGPYKWQVDQANPLAFPEPIEGYGNSISDTGEGRLLVNCGNRCVMYDKHTLQLDDLKTLEYISESNGAHSLRQNWPEYSIRDNSILSATSDGGVSYNITNNKPTLFSSSVSRFGIIKNSPRSKYIAYATGGRCTIYDFVTKKVICELVNPNNRLVQSIAWHPSENYIAVCSTGGDVHIWNVNNRTEIAKQLRHSAFTCNMQFIKGGEQLLTCGIDGTVKIFTFDAFGQAREQGFIIPSYALQELNTEIPINQRKPIISRYTLKVNPDNISIYRKDNGNFVKKINYERDVMDGYFSSDDKYVSILGSNRRVTIFEIESGRKVSSSLEFSNYLDIRHVDYDKDSNLMLILLGNNSLSICSSTYGYQVYGPAVFPDAIETISFVNTTKGLAVKVDSLSARIKYLIFGGYKYSSYKMLCDIYTCSEIDDTDLNIRMEPYAFNGRSSFHLKEMANIKSNSALKVALLDRNDTLHEILGKAQADAPIVTKQLTAQKQVVTENELIDFRNANNYIDREVSIDYVVRSTGHIGRICFLNYERNRRDFVVTMFSESFQDMEIPPDEFFLNKRLLVTGVITVHKGNPQIEVHDLKQIKVLTDDATVTVKIPPSKPNAKLVATAPAKVGKESTNDSEHAQMQDKMINYKNAREYVGQEVSVEIVVINTGNIGKICFLNVDKSREFTVPIFAEAFKDVPDGKKPEDYFLNKKLRVTGVVALFKDKPQIEVRDLRQIKVIDFAEAQDLAITAKKPLQQINFDLPRIKPNEAAQNYGKAIVIEGMVEHVKKINENYLIDFGEYPAEEQLTLVMPKEISAQLSRKPEEMFLYEHVLVCGQIDLVKNKPVLQIDRLEQVRFDRLSEKIAKAKIATIAEALQQEDTYLGVSGKSSDIQETDYFYFVNLVDSEGNKLRIAVDKLCLDPNNAKTILEKSGTIFYGVINKEGKAAQMIIADPREIFAPRSK